MAGFDWTCPYCNRAQIVTGENFSSPVFMMHIGLTRYGRLGARVESIRCLNSNCNEAIVSFELGNVEWNNATRDYEIFDPVHQSWNLRPDSHAKPQPDFIPPQLIEDYREACLIRDLSPKASATLSRRCLQGMLRNFCGIEGHKTLYAEISALRKLIEEGNAPRGVAPETVDAIDAVRGIGNIGAHMEADISVIIDVDPGEAQSLIDLIELLFDEWYVARHNRTEKLLRVQAVAAEKKAEIAEGLLQVEQRKAIAKLSEA